jgi:hypothetical protein
MQNYFIGGANRIGAVSLFAASPDIGLYNLAVISRARSLPRLDSSLVGSHKKLVR